MSDERRVRADDEDERRRARIHAARHDGGLCAGCGRALAADEPVWWESFTAADRGARARLWAPVGRECASPELLRATAGKEPAWCRACGRGVYRRAASRAQDRVLCSRLCRQRYAAARAKEARSR